MNEIKKKMNMGASVVIVVLMLTMLFIPLSNAAPIQPFERSGTTTANTVVTAWIDGVQYGSNTSDASGNFVISIDGDDVDTTGVKDGGVNGDVITYMIGGSFATETDTFTSGSSVTGDLSVAGTQPAMLKISKIVTQPNDGNNNQCLYIYNPTSSAVDLSAYQLEKDDGAYVSSVVPLSGTVAAGDYAYVELTSSYFNTAGDEVKLNFTTTGVIVDRVEFGTQSAVPDNTIMGDAPAPGSGEEIYRTPNPDTDTDDCSADFTTGPATDRIAPTVSSTTPADGATGVAVGANIVVVYSESMDTSVTPSLSDSLSTTYNFAGWSKTNVANDTATWTHADWAPSTTVNLTVSGGQDVAGNVQTSYSWSFTTEPHTATATGPTNTAASNVADITITYDYDSGTTGVDLYYTTDGGSTWTSIGSDSSIDGSYAWTIPADGTYGWIAVGDGESAPASGDAPEAASYTYDGTAPTVSSTTPADGDTDVSVSADIVVVYSESMDTSVTPSLSDNLGTSYTFDSWTDDHTAKWTHADWDTDTTVNLTVSGAKDVAGNTQTSYSWSFTTESPSGVATVARGLWVEKNASANNIILHWIDTGSTEWHIYGSQNMSNVTDPSNLIATVSGPANSWTHTGAYGDGLNWYYVVRGSDGAGTESTNSTMGYKQLYTFTYNSSRANINWIAIPLNVSYFSSASAIVTDIEGGTGSGTNTKIQQVGLWDPSQQLATVYGYKAAPLHKWVGTDFATYPGCGVFLNVVSNFTWVVNGTDTNDALTFTYNSSRANINWISLPITSTYQKASDIVTDIEGGTGSGTNTKIQQVGLWDPSQQLATVYGYKAAPLHKWVGTDFATYPGCGVFLNIVSNFTWNPQLITPEVP